MNSDQLTTYADQHAPIRYYNDGAERIGHLNRVSKRLSLVMRSPHPNPDFSGRLPQWIELNEPQIAAIHLEKGILVLPIPLHV